jgi:hypothetical protein
MSVSDRNAPALELFAFAAQRFAALFALLEPIKSNAFNPTKWASRLNSARPFKSHGTPGKSAIVASHVDA